jgi:hypothetical protein
MVAGGLAKLAANMAAWHASRASPGPPEVRNEATGGRDQTDYLTPMRELCRVHGFVMPEVEDLEIMDNSELLGIMKEIAGMETAVEYSRLALSFQYRTLEDHRYQEEIRVCQERALGKRFAVTQLPVCTSRSSALIFTLIHTPYTLICSCSTCSGRLTSH